MRLMFTLVTMVIIVCSPNAQFACGTRYHKIRGEYSRTKPQRSTKPENTQGRKGALVVSDTGTLVKHTAMKETKRIVSAIHSSQKTKQTDPHPGRSLEEFLVPMGSMHDMILPNCLPATCTRDQYIRAPCRRVMVHNVNGRKCRGCAVDVCRASRSSVVRQPNTPLNIGVENFPSSRTMRTRSFLNDPQIPKQANSKLLRPSENQQEHRSNRPDIRAAAAALPSLAALQNTRDPFSRSVQEQHLAMQNDWFMHDDEFMQRARDFRASLLLDPVSRVQQDFRGNNDATSNNNMVISDVNPAIVSQIGFSRRFTSGQDPLRLVGAPLGDPTVFETVDPPRTERSRNDEREAFANGNKFGGLNSWATS